jgi:hypothetical protein
MRSYLTTAKQNVQGMITLYGDYPEFAKMKSVANEILTLYGTLISAPGGSEYNYMNVILPYFEQLTNKWEQETNLIFELFNQLKAEGAIV